MKVRVLLTSLMVVMLLMSFMTPHAVAQEPSITHDSQRQPRAATVEELQDQYAAGLISEDQYSMMLLELETAGPSAYGIEGTGIHYRPPGWSVVDNAGTGNVWDDNETLGGINRTTAVGGSGLSMAADPDATGLSRGDTELWSPPIDFTAATPPDNPRICEQLPGLRKLRGNLA